MTDCAGIQHRKKKGPRTGRGGNTGQQNDFIQESNQSIVVVVSVRETREIPFSGEDEDLFSGGQGGGGSGCSEGNSPDEPSRWEEKRREDRIGERRREEERKKRKEKKKDERKRRNRRRRRRGRGSVESERVGVEVREEEEMKLKSGRRTPLSPSVSDRERYIYTYRVQYGVQEETP